MIRDETQNYIKGVVLTLDRPKRAWVAKDKCFELKPNVFLRVGILPSRVRTE